MGPAPSDINFRRDLRCPSGKYFNKIKVKSGALIDGIELWCTDGTYQEQRGGGGTERQPFDCSTGFTEGKIRHGAQMDGLQLRCSDGRWSDWWGGQGGSEYNPKCEDNKVITAFNGIGLRNGIVTVGTELNRVLECGNRVDCYDDNNLFHDECKNKTDDAYKNKVQNFCNSNDDRAKSSNCINWCKENVSRCTLLNDLNDCVKHGISRPDCSRQRINDIQAQCGKYKIIMSELGSGEYPCNVNNISTLKSDCQKLNIPDESCSPTGLEAEKDRETQRKLTEESQKQAQQRYEESQAKADEKYNQTQALIAQTIGLPPPEPKKSKPSEENEQEESKPTTEEDYTMYIIIAIIIFIICSILSSSSISLLMRDKE